LESSPSRHTLASAKHHAASFTARQRSFALVIVSLAFVMDLLDSTIVNIAIPSIQTNLHASYSAIQWLIAGYLLSFATLLITGGRMGDVYGYKKLFMVGVAGFTVASLLSGLAWSPGILIAARILQGAMAALMVPQVMSLMQVMYEPHERGSIMGLFGALGGLAATLGPIVGGLLIQLNIAGLDWRPIFLINVPVGILAFVAAAKILPNGKSEHPLKLDVVGTFVIIAAMFFLIFPLVQGRELGWPLWTFVMMAAAVPALIIFAFYERKKMALDESALVVPQLFRTKSFVTGLTVNVVFEMLFIGYFLIFTLMLQAGLGFSVIKAALTGIPFAVGIGLSIAFSGQKLVPKLGRYVINLGTIVMAIGYGATAWLIHHYGLSLSPWILVPALLLSGLGAGMIMAVIFGIVLNDVDVKHAGSASGVLNAIQQVGGAVGIALIGVIFFGLLTNGATPSVTAATPQIRSELSAAMIPAAAQDSIIAGFGTCFHDRATEKDASVIPASCQVAQSNQLPDMLSQKISSILASGGKRANEANFAWAFNWSIAFEGALLVVVFGLSFLLPREIKPESAQLAG
jgi:EmrB/QacA subfamily drug resistance transporter